MGCETCSVWLFSQQYRGRKGRRCFKSSSSTWLLSAVLLTNNCALLLYREAGILGCLTLPPYCAESDLGALEFLFLCMRMLNIKCGARAQKCLLCPDPFHILCGLRYAGCRPTQAQVRWISSAGCQPQASGMCPSGFPCCVSAISGVGVSTGHTKEWLDMDFCII